MPTFVSQTQQEDAIKGVRGRRGLLEPDGLKLFRLFGKSGLGLASDKAVGGCIF